MMARQNITDRAKRNLQPWTLPRADRSYYVHGLYGAKTATLAGSYGTKPEALKAARRLANEENEDVSISVPKGAMIVVHPNPATRKNLFGFGRKPAPLTPRRGRGGLSLSEASSAALKAGRKSADLSDFGSWLEAKHLDDRSDGFVSRVRDSYARGVDKAEADEQNKEFLKQKREQAREVARDRREQARDARQERASAGRGRKAKAATEESPYRSAPSEEAIQAGFKRGLTLNEILRGNPALRALRKSNPAKFDRCVKQSRRKNSAAASAEVFEEFHGFAPSEVITVTKKIHYHKHLAAAGKLTHLDVWGVDGAGHKISGFKGAFLAFNKSKNQLFVEGGDQAVNLEDFGIRQAHELETLGRLTDIGYQTNKTHLGNEGGEAVYVHKFRSTNENGRHVIVRIARYPDLIYDVRSEQLLFSGGSYEILREGIDK
jgi:hypothetical protein